MATSESCTAPHWWESDAQGSPTAGSTAKPFLVAHEVFGQDRSRWTSRGTIDRPETCTLTGDATYAFFV
ncbi:MAG: hypothetical protein GY938_22595 [Ketobacter sp.]|nr:hypothetical protein [Ketobacter sp.]